jgi:hypothetical protein
MTHWTPCPLAARRFAEARVGLSASVGSLQIARFDLHRQGLARVERSELG